MSQRNHRLDANRPSRRDPAGKDPDGGDQQNDGRERQRIVRRRIPELSRQQTIGGEAEGEPEPEPQQPAVSVRASVKPDYIVCLEDGKKLTMMRRYLMTNFGMTPDEYRAKWHLPKDYPMTAPNYAAQRKELAHKIGLGRKPGQGKKAATSKAAAPKGRAKRGTEVAAAE